MVSERTVADLKAKLAEARRKALLEAADHCEESDIMIPIEEIHPDQTKREYAGVVIKHLAIELRQMAQESDHA